MKYEIVGKTGVTPSIAILCPRIQTEEIRKHYYNPHLESLGKDVMVCDLYLDKTKKKTSADDIKEYLGELLPNLVAAGITMVVVTQPEYFKVLTKQAKTDSTIGDVLPSIHPGLTAAYCPNYSRIFYDPDKTKAKIKTGLDSVVRWMNGDTSTTGSTIITFEDYPKTDDEIIRWLEKLYYMQCDLTCDIEGFSLKHYDAGIGTITFCWNEHEGIAFPVDYQPMFDPETKTYGVQIKSLRVRRALKRFFEIFEHKMIYHNICYDAYVLIYQLFMTDILDQEGLLTGLDVMLKNWDCSQLITYLATNSCAGNELGLKTQAQEFAGNYAQEEIHDITKIELNNLLKYNLIDGLATWFTYNKNLPIMIADQQVGVYQEIFRPAVLDIIQMQLTGMPVNMGKVKKLDKLLQKESAQLLADMNGLTLVQSFMDDLGDRVVAKKNAKLKTKQITKADLGKTKDTIVEFNPNSPNQLQRLLFDEDCLGLPVLDYTDTKQPSTGAETLEKLLSHTKDPDTIRFLELLIEYKASAIILSTFIPAFLKAALGSDDWHYLFGNFRLGGTASGRLSSNNPNLQNIPSNGSSKAKQRLAKLIKECFEAPPGWLFVGLDFDSLEDKISAVTTRDPEKIKVYSDGYDGHCLRALAYFGDHMPNIETCPDGAEAYEATIGDTTIYFHSEEEIEYLGQSMKGSELFNQLKLKDAA
jgi:DNA polymerase I